jgi:hypothetical protein
VRRNVLLVDAAIAVAVAVFVLIIAPGLAVVGMLALLVIVICLVSFAIDGWRHRPRQPRPPRRAPRRPPPRRPPPPRSARRTYGSGR